MKGLKNISKYDPEIIKRIQERFKIVSMVERKRIEKDERRRVRDIERKRRRLIQLKEYNRKHYKAIKKVKEVAIWKKDWKLKNHNEQPEEAKQKDKAQEPQEKTITKNFYPYHCKECNAIFKSPLPPKEAVCIKCGSSKIQRIYY